MGVNNQSVKSQNHKSTAGKTEEQSLTHSLIHSLSPASPALGFFPGRPPRNKDAKIKPIETVAAASIVSIKPFTYCFGYSKNSPPKHSIKKPSKINIARPITRAK